MNIFFNKSSLEQNGILQIKAKNIVNSNNKIELGNKYIISEKSQIFPLYSLTLKRNEYFVLFRDPNFNENNEYFEILEKLKILLNMNIYYERSTEEALKFLVKRKFNKVILITTIEDDLSGKRFIEIARKIFESNMIVLFYSKNKINENHFDWMKKTINCLYTDEPKIIEEFIKNYSNKDRLNEIKKKVEQKYNISLRPISSEFCFFQNFKNYAKIYYLHFYSHYIRHVYIKNGDNYISMEKDGKIYIDSELCQWDITLLNDEITFFSNGFYLDINEDKINVRGNKNMKIWNIDFIDTNQEDFYCFLKRKDRYQENNYYLNIDKKKVIVDKECKEENKKFKLVDISEDNTININSSLSHLIKDEFSSVDIQNESNENN